jgi:hypothetical protein
MRIRRKFRRALVATAAPLVAALAVASPAQAVITDPQLTLDPNSAVFIQPNTMQLSGTLVCTAGNDYALFFFVRQPGAGRGDEPFGYSFVEQSVCETSGLRTWTLQTNPQDVFGQLHAGNAFVAPAITMCDGVTCESFSVERNVVFKPA